MYLFNCHANKMSVISPHENITHFHNVEPQFRNFLLSLQALLSNRDSKVAVIMMYSWIQVPHRTPPTVYSPLPRASAMIMAKTQRMSVNFITSAKTSNLHLIKKSKNIGKTRFSVHAKTSHPLASEVSFLRVEFLFMLILAAIMFENYLYSLREKRPQRLIMFCIMSLS